jgi:lysophospholipase L1-like esterase
MQTLFEKHAGIAITIMAASSLLLTLVALEALLAYIAPVGTHSQRYVRLRELTPEQNTKNIPSPKSLEGTDSLKREEYPLRTDSNGFISAGKVHSTPDLRIFFLGGSTTECLYVPALARFPYLSSRLIERKLGRKVNAYNAGVSGNHTLHSLISLQCKIVPLKPDIVVMMHNINDLVTLFLTGTYYNDHAGRSIIITEGESSRIRHLRDALFPNLYNCLRSFAPVRWLRDEMITTDEWRHIRGKNIDRNSQMIVEAFSENLLAFVSFCRIKGIIPILMTQASRLTEEPEGVVRIQYEQFTEDYGMSYRDFRNLFIRMNEATKQVARTQGVLLIDLANRIPQRSQFMYDVVHFTEAGSRLAAEIINEAMVHHIASIDGLK